MGGNVFLETWSIKGQVQDWTMELQTFTLALASLAGSYAEITTRQILRLILKPTKLPPACRNIFRSYKITTLNTLSISSS